MKKHLTLFITILLLTTWVAAQTPITGTVKDQKGHPVPGASITLKDTYDGATSDSLGNFHFSSGEKGDHILSVTNIGYTTTEQPVTLNGSPIELRIIIKEQLSELKAVTITAVSGRLRVLPTHDDRLPEQDRATERLCLLGDRLRGDVLGPDLVEPPVDRQHQSEQYSGGRPGEQRYADAAAGRRWQSRTGSAADALEGRGRSSQPGERCTA